MIAKPPSETAQRLLLKIPEVAQMLALSKATIYNMCASGELSSIKKGRAVRISSNAITEWITTHERIHV